MGKCYVQLNAEERGVIMAMRLQGCGRREISRALGRSSSTVVRELHRNRWRGGSGVRPACGYDARRAGERARRLRIKPRVQHKLRRDGSLWRDVRSLLGRGWSPQQIAGRLRHAYPDQPGLRVSHETIYTAIYAAPRGQLRRELIALLRQHRGRRGARRVTVNRRGRLPDLPSIHLRPPEANERLLPGHWEGDLIMGSKASKSAVGTLVDRHSLFVIVAKLEGATAKAALEGFATALGPIPAQYRKTLTYDQGKEMALHRQLAACTGLSIYFADPHSPWQRGICENTNGLLRQYLPKGCDLSVYSQRDLDRIAWSLNTRPRKTLGFATPAEVFFRHLYSQMATPAQTDALGD